MAGLQKAKKGKKQRKHGRNEGRCKTYAALHIREKNKVARLKKHLARYPEDRSALAAVEAATAAIRGY